MKKYLLLTTLLGGLLLPQCNPSPPDTTHSQEKFALVIHGGAGVILKENMSDELEKQYLEKLEEALQKGFGILKNGGTALEAVENTIRVMEDSPLFNAGKGAVFTHEGKNELDASVMDGRTLNAGAIAGVGDVKNPISLAKEVMLHSPHVMLTGKGASKFAKNQGIEIVDSSYFFTEKRWKSLQDALKKANGNKFGTVGCVALDQNGDIVAGTSTGGMTNKQFGRIGDAPVIGAGTYANNETCGISATGHGEFFIRYCVAHDISALMQYQGKTLEEAAQLVINEKLRQAGGDGGIIGLDKYGNISMVFNTPGMYRGYMKSSGAKEIAIFKKEQEK